MGSCEVEPRTETPDMARIRGAPGRPPRIPAGGPVQDLLGDACGRAARATSRIRGPARRRGVLGVRAERRRQQPSQQLMVALGEAHGELISGAQVQLRGPTRPRAASPGEAAILGPEQAELDDLSRWNAASARLMPISLAASSRLTASAWRSTNWYSRRRVGSRRAAIASSSRGPVASPCAHGTGAGSSP